MEDKKLRKVGLKITNPRLKILQILEKNESRHLSAEAIYKSLIDLGEEVAFATVYRVLTQFEDHGIVKRHYFEGGYSVFELAQMSHHDHLICEKCNTIVEFVDEVIEQHQRDIAQHAGFRITNHSLIIYGICEKCENPPS